MYSDEYLEKAHTSIFMKGKSIVGTSNSGAISEYCVGWSCINIKIEEPYSTHQNIGDRVTMLAAVLGRAAEEHE